MKKTFLLLSLFVVLLGTVPLSTQAASDKIVQYTNLYSYDMMTKHLQQLQKTYPDAIQLQSIGKTAYNRDIWAVRVGRGDASIFINGSHHAREWITSILNMTMIENYARSYSDNTSFEGYPTKEILDHMSIWFVPMVNPDGVTLQQFGLDAFPKQEHSKLIQMNEGSIDFTKWKANAQGIDLNRQYDADWGNIRANSGKLFWWNYKGPRPVYANETKAMVEFTYRIKPEIAVSYHSSGEILFWNFHTLPKNLERDRKLAAAFAQLTGYSLVKPTSNPSGGGYTDWFISTFNKPGFTPEVGVNVSNRHVPVKYFETIWKQNKKSGIWLASEGYKLWYSHQSKTAAKEDFKKVIVLSGEQALYNEPNILKPSTGKIKEQTVTALSKKGDWYLIQTKLGDQWIYEPNAVIEEPKEMETEPQEIETEPQEIEEKNPGDTTTDLQEITTADEAA